MILVLRSSKEGLSPPSISGYSSPSKEVKTDYLSSDGSIRISEDFGLLGAKIPDLS